MNRKIEIGKEILAESMIIAMGSSSAIFASNLSLLGANAGFIFKYIQNYKLESCLEFGALTAAINTMG